MSERKAFKAYFDVALVQRIADGIRPVEPGFDADRFVRTASAGLGGLEMMARVGQIADALQMALPGPTAARMAALRAALPPVAPSAEGITDNGYVLWPFGELIARHGLDDVDASFTCMLELTQRFTAEFAVRPFLDRDPDGMLDRLAPLCAHPSEHVRRWVSEGTRTRLPWGKRVPALEQRLERRLDMLATLRRDPSRYVQRSVANHLGDVLKQDRVRGLAVLEAWMAEGHPVTAWIVRHAARNALKQGDARALALVGQAPSADLQATRFRVDPDRVAAGEAVELQAELVHRGRERVSVRLDYRLDSPGAGARRNVRTFRWADLSLEAGSTVTVRRRHVFVERSTRALRPGRHRLVLLVNGSDAASVEVVVSLLPTA